MAVKDELPVDSFDEEFWDYISLQGDIVTEPPGAEAVLFELLQAPREERDRAASMSTGVAPKLASEPDASANLDHEWPAPMTKPMFAQINASTLGGGRGFDFAVDAEMIIFGSTKCDAHVTLAGEPIKVRQDGSFTVRMSLPDRRQVLPVTSSSRDGATQQTIVLAIERNTKVMEPVVRDAAD